MIFGVHVALQAISEAKQAHMNGLGAAAVAAGVPGDRQAPLQDAAVVRDSHSLGLAGANLSNLHVWQQRHGGGPLAVAPGCHVGTALGTVGIARSQVDAGAGIDLRTVLAQHGHHAKLGVQVE